MSNKTRLDVLLTERGLLDSRQKAQATIMSGIVFVDGTARGQGGDNGFQRFQYRDARHNAAICQPGRPEAGKGHDRRFRITLEGKVCADIGASTGGFTDCMLQNGAKKVYAVDVGYGQLDWKLRNDRARGVHGAHKRPLSDP